MEKTRIKKLETMKNIVSCTFTLSLIIFSCFDLYCQTNSDSLNRAIIKESITDKSLHNVLNLNKPIIKDSITAISVAEPILFGLYGKKTILSEKPYSIHHIDNYWMISGTLPKGSLGGTFLIIIDEMDCKVIRITHGK
jgi:hypothetical protein